MAVYVYGSAAEEPLPTLGMAAGGEAEGEWRGRRRRAPDGSDLSPRTQELRPSAGYVEYDVFHGTKERWLVAQIVERKEDNRRFIAEVACYRDWDRFVMPVVFFVDAVDRATA